MLVGSTWLLNFISDPRTMTMLAGGGGDSNTGASPIPSEGGIHMRHCLRDFDYWLQLVTLPGHECIDGPRVECMGVLHQYKQLVTLPGHTCIDGPRVECLGVIHQYTLPIPMLE